MKTIIFLLGVGAFASGSPTLAFILVGAVVLLEVVRHTLGGAA